MARKVSLMACIGATVLASLVAALESAHADDKAAAKGVLDAKAAFAQMKTLAGTWKCQISDQHQAPDKDKGENHPREATVVYKVTGAGSALVETQFPGTDHEMVSVYHLDRNELKMTHYCAMGNQPKVKLDRVRSTPTHLIFVFDGGTNLDPQKDMHIHGLEVTFHDDGKVTSAWDGYSQGKKAGTTSFLMTKL